MEDFQLTPLNGGWDRSQVLDEALLRQKRSDELFLAYHVDTGDDRKRYDMICHLRQSAASLFAYANGM